MSSFGWCWSAVLARRGRVVGPVRPLGAAARTVSKERRLLRCCGESDEEGLEREEGEQRGGGAEGEARLGSQARRTATTCGLYVTLHGRGMRAGIPEASWTRPRSDKPGSKNDSKPSVSVKLILEAI